MELELERQPVSPRSVIDALHLSLQAVGVAMVQIQERQLAAEQEQTLDALETTLSGLASIAGLLSGIAPHAVYTVAATRYNIHDVTSAVFRMIDEVRGSEEG